MLQLDIGNSRIKYRLTNQVSEITAVHTPDELPKSMDVVFSSVRTEARTREVVARYLAAGARCRQAVVCSQDVLRCDYEQPSLLGVDRWLAALGATQIASPAIVVDAGTALTVDLVVDGVYHGGVIAQGLRCSVASLLAGTDRVNDVDFDVLPGVPANTGAAVGLGAVAQAVGLIEWLRARWSPQAAIVLTGGDALLLQSHLSPEVVYKEGLIFDGLGLAELKDFT